MAQVFSAEKATPNRQDASLHLAYGVWLALAIASASSNAQSILGVSSRYVLIAAYAVTALLLLSRVPRLRYPPGELFLFLSIIVAASLAAYLTSLTAFLGAALFVFASRSADLRQLARTTLLGGLGGLLIVTLLVASGDALDLELVRVGSDWARHSFGFRHPNTLGMLILNLCLAWVVLAGPRSTLLWKLPVVGAAFFCWSLLDSRSAILLLVVLLTLWGLRSTRVGELVLLLAPLVPMLAVLATLILTFMYEPTSPTWAALDEALSSRLSLGHAYLTAYGVSPLGQPIALGDIPDSQLGSLVATGRATVDVGYISLLLQAGWVGLLAFTSLLVLAGRNARASGDRSIAICTVVFALSGVFETTVYGLQYGFCLFVSAMGTSTGGTVGMEQMAKASLEKRNSAGARKWRVR